MNQLTNQHPPRFNRLEFFLNLAAILLFALIAFTYNPGMLFRGNDGPVGFSLAEEQLYFFGITPHLHSNFLEGLANISCPWNLAAIPGYWFASFFHSGSFDFAVIYIWFALQLFVSVLVIGWNYGVPKRTTYAAAWLLTVLLFPFFEEFRIYSITSSCPYFLTNVMVFAIMDVGIQHIGLKNWQNTIFYGGVILFGLIIGMIICAPTLMLIAPLLAITTIYSFTRKLNRRQWLQKLITLLAILIIAIIAGWLELFLGLILNSIGSFFNAEMSPGYTPDLVYASILFQGSYSGMKVGPWLFGASAIGAIIAIRKSKTLRHVAIMVCIAQVLVVCCGVLLLNLPTPWVGPSPIYSEIILFPFYAIFTAYLFGTLIQKIPMGRFTSGWLHLYYPFVVAGILIVTILIQKPVTTRSGSGLPPASTSITTVLENEIALSQNAPFRGRVANIIPGVYGLNQVISYFGPLDAATGNDHQTSGLWLKHIPTLHEYIQTISPGFYRLYRRFLTVPEDVAHRSWTNFTHVDHKILRLIGVRFILSTLPDMKDVNQRVKMSTNVKELPPLYLYELQNPNVSGISASRIINAKNVAEAEDLMASNHFNLQDAVIIQPEAINNTQYVSAIESKLTMKDGGIHLQAISKGLSLLILPIEYSHCLTIKPIIGAAPKIVRVDVGLTGVLFNRSIDIMIDSRTGPFANPRCRWQDYREFSSIMTGVKK